MQETAVTGTQGPAVPRRGLIKALLGFSIGATLVGALTPIFSYLWPPAARSGAESGQVRAVSLVELQAAGGLVRPVGDRPIMLTYSENAGVRAFSAICTHLGCIVNWKAEGGYIESPCHDGRFNAQTGAVISGPPPSPLPAYDVVVDGDDVYVVI